MHRLILFASLVCLPVLSVWAEDEAFRFFEEEAKVVSASHHEQKLSEAPATAYVITAEDIERYGYRNLAEALQSVPGVFGTDDRYFTSLWFRGFEVPSDYNDRILILLDGHRLNENIDGAASADYNLSIDMKAVDHIEVIKGPASALYGDNAFFGVVNIVTKSAGQAPLIHASAEGGSYGTHREFIGLAPSYSNGVKAYLTGSNRHSDGQDLHYQEFSTINNGIASGCNGEKDRSFYAKLSYQGWTLMGNNGTQSKQIPTASYGTIFNDPGTKTRYNQSFLELKGEHQVLPELQLTSRAYYDRYDYRGDYMYANDAPPPDVIRNMDVAIARSYGEELRARLTPYGQKNALTIGEEYMKMARNLQQNFNEGSPPAIDMNITPYHWATYLQQELQPYRALSLTLGARYDYYQLFGKTINPRLAAVHRLWTDSVLKAMVGSAFRGPTAYEMFYADGISVAPNSSLQPEKIKSYELAWEQQFPGRGMVSVSAYRNEITNLIEETAIADGLVQSQNKSSARGTGLEVYSKWSWSASLSGFAGYLLQNSRKENDSPVINSPRHSGSAGLTAWIEPTKTRVSLKTFFVSERQTLQGTSLPTATLFALTLREQPWKAGPDFYASVHNLFNTSYSVPAGAANVQNAIPQDGRDFTFGFDYKFR